MRLSELEAEAAEKARQGREQRQELQVRMMPGLRTASRAPACRLALAFV